jgi:hypothetical protein
MSNNDRRGTNVRPSSVPEAPAQIANWDDETVPGLDLDDPLNEFDRVTAVPELPSEQYVKSVMETAEDSRVPPPGTPPPRPSPPAPRAPLPAIPALGQDDYFSLDSEPPPSPRSADSTAPYAAVLPHDAPTARPAPGEPFSAGTEPTLSVNGLELAQLDDSDAAPTAPFKAGSDALGDMKDRYAMGDFSGALAIAEGILDKNPQDLEAPRYAQSCRDVLTQMYSARLGSLERIVAVAVPSDQIRWLTLDHRAGFLLSLIDGGLSVDQILDISGMPRLDALRLMYQLLDQRVISLGS